MPRYPLRYIMTLVLVINTIISIGLALVMWVAAHIIPTDPQKTAIFWFGMGMIFGWVFTLRVVGGIFEAFDPDVRMIAYELRTGTSFLKTDESKTYPELREFPLENVVVNVPMLDEKMEVSRGLRFHGEKWQDWVKTCKVIARAGYEFKIGSFAGVSGGRRLHDIFRALWLKDEVGILQEKTGKEVELTNDGKIIVRRISKLPHNLKELPVFLDV